MYINTCTNKFCYYDTTKVKSSYIDAVGKKHEIEIKKKGKNKKNADNFVVIPFVYFFLFSLKALRTKQIKKKVSNEVIIQYLKFDILHPYNIVSN